MGANNLIDTEDILKSAKLNRIGGISAARIIMLVLKIDKINKIYAENWFKGSLEFIDSLLEILEIKFDISEEDLNRIPKTGPFITISNHPYGGLEGILLLKLISSRRADYKLMANDLLQRIEPLQDMLLPVNPFETKRDFKSSISGIKQALTHLQDGKGGIGIFPAGEVSTYYQFSGAITDKQWENPILKFIKKANVPIIPIHFQGTNSRLFHLLGMIHPMLRKVKLPSEFLNKKNKNIKIRIGNPINLKEQEEFSDISRFGRFLRAKTYALDNSMEVKKFFIPHLHRAKKEEEIIEPVASEYIIQEINSLRKDFLLFSMSEFSVFCAPSVKLPYIMTEIGRLREITFRGVGEGTNRKLDIDEFDLYYHQLFVWDENAKQIVGAYRAGKGQEILNLYGINGFYTQTLFKINKGFIPVLKETIELGRSFIIPEYQRKPMPLFLLWKGILYFLLKNPEYRYLVGPVSISDRFSTFSKTMIIHFIKKHYYGENLAQYIKPRNSFKVPATSSDTDFLFENTDNLIKLEKLIEEVETSHHRMPVLLKRYLKLNGKIIGFNIDPKFNDCMDGLMILDLFDVPFETIASLSKEIKDDSILERFYSNDGTQITANS